jgi:hypothetical protein
VPTTRPRYQVTETDELAAALDAAERRWPGVPRSRLLLRVLELGEQAVIADQAERDERRAAAIRAAAGTFDDAFDEDFLRNLRQDWPE